MLEVLESVLDFQRFEVLDSVYDFPVFEVLGSVQYLRGPEVFGWQVTKSCTLPFLPGRKPSPVASLAGKKVMPCSAFTRQNTWCARAHGFARPRDSRLSEMRICTLLRCRVFASR